MCLPNKNFSTSPFDISRIAISVIAVTVEKYGVILRVSLDSRDNKNTLIQMGQNASEISIVRRLYCNAKERLLECKRTRSRSTTGTSAAKAPSKVEGRAFGLTLATNRFLELSDGGNLQ